MEFEKTDPSDFELEKTLLESPTIPQEWLDSPAIQERIEAFKKGQSDFLAKHPFSQQWEEIANKHPFRKKRLLNFKWVLPTLAVAASLIFVFRTDLFNLTNPNYLGSKGNFDFGLYYKREGAPTEKVNSGITLKKGDRIRFSYASPVDAYLMIIGIEENGEVNLYFPEETEASVKISANEHKNLPQAFAINASQPKERFIALFSNKPLSLDEVKQTVARKLQSQNFLESEQPLFDKNREISILVRKE
ncbi:MAG: DUF4384 domain-containing protein [Deltaproteobacteria bacterium]|nr:DUF4384 domain-containing protein [Deltaproteobacteria bacterium]